MHTPTPSISPPSLHDALPILRFGTSGSGRVPPLRWHCSISAPCSRYSASSTFTHSNTHSSKKPSTGNRDRKSTRLNSSHSQISYAVFCLKKKKKKTKLCSQE